LTVSKKPRFGPKVASQAWWIDRIKKEEGPKYLKYWTHITDYQIGQFKALAEFDYFVLGEGIETQGAPDFGLGLEYPVKLVRKPFLGRLEHFGVQGLQALDLDSGGQSFGEAPE